MVCLKSAARRLSLRWQPQPNIVPPGPAGEDGDMSPHMPEEIHLPTVIPRPQALGRGQRTRWPTWKILESLPQPSAPITEDLESIPAVRTAQLNSEPGPPTTISKVVRTPANIFGLYREYLVTSHVEAPDDSRSLSDMSYQSHTTLSESRMAAIP